MENLKSAISNYITKGDNLQSLNDILIQTKNNDNPMEIVEFIINYIENQNVQFKRNSFRLICLIFERLPKLKITSDDICRLFNFSKNKLNDQVISSSAMRLIYCIII
jgi:hypothetical protein